MEPPGTYFRLSSMLMIYICSPNHVYCESYLFMYERLWSLCSSYATISSRCLLNTWEYDLTVLTCLFVVDSARS